MTPSFYAVGHMPNDLLNNEPDAGAKHQTESRLGYQVSHTVQLLSKKQVKEAAEGDNSPSKDASLTNMTTDFLCAHGDVSS